MALGGRTFVAYMYFQVRESGFYRFSHELAEFLRQSIDRSCRSSKILLLTAIYFGTRLVDAVTALGPLHRGSAAQVEAVDWDQLLAEAETNL